MQTLENTTTPFRTNEHMQITGRFAMSRGAGRVLELVGGQTALIYD
jgi:hypothetical protein